MGKKTPKNNNSVPPPARTFSNLTIGIAAVLLLAIAGAVSYPVLKSNRSLTPIVVNTPQIPEVTNTTNTDVASKKEIKALTIDFNRAVYLLGEVDGNIQQQINQILELAAQSNEPIYLLIESPGGSVFDGYKLLSAIESSRAPVYTVCMSICASMAAVIHQYGAKRLAFDRATLMFHDAAGGLQGDVKKMTTRLTYLNRILEKVDRYIAAKSKMSYDQFMQLHAYEMWIDAEDALKLHLVDDIIQVQSPGRMIIFENPDKGDGNKNNKLDIKW